jgi:membrane-anchored glycerophosphoryl diester phosphodiesterase (GDPDase)
MKKYHNMTDEDIQSNEDLFIENQPEPIKIGAGFLIMFCVFVVMVIAIIYYDNKVDNLRADLKTEKLKVKKQQEVIVDLKKLYSKKK